MSQHPFKILLIEDNRADVYLLRRALQEEAPCDITELADGDEAFAFIQRLNHSAPPFDLIVLDLNLPGRDGAEILRAIQSNPALVRTPVAVLSSSPCDIIKRQAASADCYLTKPYNLDEFMALAKALLECARQGKR